MFGLPKSSDRMIEPTSSTRAKHSSKVDFAEPLLSLSVPRSTVSYFFFVFILRVLPAQVRSGNKGSSFAANDSPGKCLKQPALCALVCGNLSSVKTVATKIRRPELNEETLNVGVRKVKEP